MICQLIWLMFWIKLALTTRFTQNPFLAGCIIHRTILIWSNLRVKWSNNMAHLTMWPHAVTTGYTMCKQKQMKDISFPNFTIELSRWTMNECLDFISSTTIFPVFGEYFFFIFNNIHTIYSNKHDYVSLLSISFQV